MQKWVKLREVKDYLAFGWRVVIIAGPPPLDYRVGWVLVEYQ